MPKKTSPPVLKTGKLTPASFLDATVRLGFAAAEQVAAAVLRLRPIQLPGSVIKHAERLAPPKGDPASLDRVTVTTDRDPLPPRRGREKYVIMPTALTSPTRDFAESGVLTTLANTAADLGTRQLGGILLREIFPALPPAQGRELLSWLLQGGYLTMDVSRASKDHICVRTTPEGLDEWTRRQRAHHQPPLAPARHPRVDHPVHHLLAVEAALEILAAKKWTLVTLRGDPDLRSEAWSTAGGSRAKRAELVEALPDAELVAVSRAGVLRSVRIEIITCRYDDQELQDKFARLDPRTEVFAPTEQTAQKARKAGWPRVVHILDGRRFGGKERDW